MHPRVRPAAPGDVPLLIRLMAEFYAEAGYTAEPGRAATAFADLLGDPAHGRVWVIEADGEPAGYIVLTLGYSMEYGGRDGFLDDLFIRAPFRGRGLGTAAVDALRTAAVSLGVRALHVEVAHGNGPAQVVYRRAGFAETGRQLLTLKLADPTHVN